MDGGGHAVHVLATADDPTHRTHRKLVLPTLVAKRIRVLEVTVTSLADQSWTVELNHGRIDWATAMADRLPLAIVARLLGLPETDVAQLLSWAYDSTDLLSGVVTADRLGHVVTSAAELAAYLHAQFEQAQQNPRDDLRGDLAQACAAGELSAEVAVLMLVQLVGAGGESTAGLIASAARLLATQPDLQDRLRSDPDLTGPFLEETLRLESPFRGHHRHVVADSTLGGVHLPAGSHLLLLWGSANRDAAVFIDPDVMVLERANIRTHLAFGKGAHFCVGAALARLEARVAVTMLLERSNHISLAEATAPEWLPSLLVRRHRSLVLAID